MKQIPVSVGIFAYNEENAIAKSLDCVLKQKTEVAQIKEILVVSSGSWDKTNSIVRNYAKKDKRIQLIEQFNRQGKSSAINLFLTRSKGEVVVISGADLRLHTKAIEEITLPFLDEWVGMAGAHPVPTNVKQSSIGKEIELMWKLHHLVSLQHPKCGETIAFRKVIKSIPKQSAVDEATIEVLLKLIGYQVIYVPRAIVYNKIPLNLNDFLTQRRRVYAGHKWITQKYNYQVSTMKVSNDLSAVIEYFSNNPQNILTLLRLIIFELMGRTLGWFDYFILNKNPYVWKMVKR